MEVVILKLISGEDVLGEVVEKNEKVFRLKNPVGVAIVRGQDGQPNVGFAPFPLHAEQKSGTELDFSREHVLYYYEPAEEFLPNYNQLFGTGLILPTKKLITG